MSQYWNNLLFCDGWDRSRHLLELFFLVLTQVPLQCKLAKSLTLTKFIESIELLAFKWRLWTRFWHTANRASLRIGAHVCAKSFRTNYLWLLAHLKRLTGDTLVLPIQSFQGKWLDRPILTDCTKLLSDNQIGTFRKPLMLGLQNSIWLTVVVYSTTTVIHLLNCDSK